MDLRFAQACLAPPAPAIIERAAGIQLLALDVDGVLTDGGVYVGAEGEIFKRFHIRDGKGLNQLKDQGVRVAFITARQSAIVETRAAELGITRVYQGVQDKAATFQSLAIAEELALQACAWVGDDIQDLGPAQLAGLAVAVADAHPAYSAQCHWQTAHTGGNGAVREVCDLLLAARGSLKPDTATP